MKTRKTITLVISIFLLSQLLSTPTKIFSQSLRDVGKIKSFQYALFYSDVAEEYKSYLPDLDNVKVMSKYYMPNVSINNSGKSNEVYYENGYILIYIGIDRVNINNQILYYGGISIQVNILSDTWDKIYERHRYLLADDITTKEFNSECSKMISDLIMEFSLEYYKHK